MLTLLVILLVIIVVVFGWDLMKGMLVRRSVAPAHAPENDVNLVAIRDLNRADDDGWPTPPASKDPSS